MSAQADVCARPLPAALPAPPPRPQTFQAALAQRQRGPAQTVLQPLVNGALGLLGALVCIALITYQPYNEERDPSFPRLKGGVQTDGSLPQLYLTPGCARLYGRRLHAGTVPDRVSLDGRHTLVVYTHSKTPQTKVAHWLTVFRRLGISQAQLVVKDRANRLHAVEVSLVAASPTRPCSGGPSSFASLIDGHRVMLEQDPHGTLIVGPSCLALVPRWLEK